MNQEQKRFGLRDEDELTAVIVVLLIVALFFWFFMRGCQTDLQVAAEEGRVMVVDAALLDSITPPPNVTVVSAAVATNEELELTPISAANLPAGMIDEDARQAQIEAEMAAPFVAATVTAPTIDFTENRTFEFGGALIEGTGEPNTDVAIIVDGEMLGRASVDATGRWAFSIPRSSLEFGTHDVVAQSGSLVSSPSTFTLNAPQIPRFAQDYNSAILPGTYRVRGTADANWQVGLRTVGNEVQLVNTDVNGNWEVMLDLNQLGLYELQAMAINADGTPNLNLATERLQLNVVETLPAVVPAPEGSEAPAISAETDNDGVGAGEAEPAIENGAETEEGSEAAVISAETDNDAIGAGEAEPAADDGSEANVTEADSGNMESDGTTDEGAATTDDATEADVVTETDSSNADSDGTEAGVAVEGAADGTDAGTTDGAVDDGTTGTGSDNTDGVEDSGSVDGTDVGTTDGAVDDGTTGTGSDNTDGVEDSGSVDGTDVGTTDGAVDDGTTGTDSDSSAIDGTDGSAVDGTDSGEADTLNDGTQSMMLEQLEADGRFTMLLAAIEIAGLTVSLDQQDSPVTLFAPTDEALSSLPAGTVEGLLRNPDALQAVLVEHMVSGAVSAADLVNFMAAEPPALTNLAGNNLPLSLEENFVKIADSNVTETDILVSNGYIHAIDRIILPPLDGQAPIIDVRGVPIFRGSVLTVIGTAEPNTVLTLMVNNQAHGTTVVNPDGTWLVTNNITTGEYKIVAYMFGEDGVLRGISAPVMLTVE